jgi:hypothetical protein
MSNIETTYEDLTNIVTRDQTRWERKCREQIADIAALKHELAKMQSEVKTLTTRLVGCLWLLRDDVRIADIRDSGDAALAEAERRGFDAGINEAVSRIASDKRETLDEWALGEIVNALIALKHGMAE